jgi:dipeptidyl aminopeptidase/acylaminoacyl peptidase
LNAGRVRDVSREAHGFNKDENRFDFYRRVEKFLAEHLGP